MEIGVRRAEAARRRKSAGGDPQGEGVPPRPLQDKAQATRPPCFLHFLHWKAAGSRQSSGTEPPPNWDPGLHGPRRFKLRDVPTSFYKAGLKRPREGSLLRVSQN